MLFLLFQAAAAGVKDGVMQAWKVLGSVPVTRAGKAMNARSISVSFPPGLWAPDCNLWNVSAGCLSAWVVLQFFSPSIKTTQKKHGVFFEGLRRDIQNPENPKQTRYICDCISPINNGTQGSYGHGKPGEIMEFKNGYFQSWKSPWKKCDPKSFGKFCIHAVWLKE